MRARFWLLPLLLAACSAGAAVAEPIGGHWELSPFGGFTLFDPKLRYPGSNLPLADDLYLGGRVSYETKGWLGIEVAAGTTPTAEDVPANGQEYDFFHASGNLVLSPARHRWGTPYLFVGGGVARLKPASGTKEDTGGIEFGGGVKMWMTDAIGLRFEARDISFKPLQETGTQENFHNVVIGAGLTFAIGGTPRDTDGDGVADKNDKCADTPKGATVDASGCPMDSDGDRVLDGLDKCPGTPKGATVDSTGCSSDADGDGIAEGVDQCPNTPKGAIVDSVGCPIDSDGDGVPDGIDLAAGTRFGAKVDSLGRPLDGDGDGVPDGIDICPQTPAGIVVDTTGCSVEVIERETELLDTGLIRLQDVNFETGKSTLLPESYTELDIVGGLMVKWPEIRMEVGGHTDSRGSAAKNQKLSEARADAVRTYIIQKYPMLDPKSLTSKGYGSTKPRAPNSSELGRAKNRRVELVVLNKEALSKVIERHKTLGQGGAAPADSTKK